MEINNQMQQSISSIRQSIGVETLKKKLSQDVQSMDALLHGFQEINAKAVEKSVTPHKGGNIDISV